VGYLGYDPEQLRRLRSFLDTLAAEQARTRFDDPLSQPAADSYGRAVSGILASRDRIDAVLACGLDRAFRPVALEVSLAAVDVLRLDDPAWTTVTDPGSSTTDPVLAAVHLAEYVAATGMADAFDPATSDALRAHLHTVAADPRAAIAFMTALGNDDLTIVVDRLWAVMATPFDDHERQRANDALSAMASILGRVERAQPGAWPAFVDHALSDEHRSITAVAVLARGASLPSATVGATFTRLSEAAMGRPEPEPALFNDDGTVLWSTAQALSDALAQQPDVANSVVASLDAATFGWLLTVTNASSTGSLLWAATSPLVQSEAEAERAVENVLTRLAGVHRLVEPELREWLGAMVAPWSGRLVAVPRSSFASSWEVASDPVAVGELRWILAAADAADFVTRWLVTTSPGSLGDVLAAGGPVTERVYDWAEQLGVAAARISSEQLDDARRRLAAWQNGWRLPLAAANNVAVHLLPIGPVTQFVATQIMAAVEDRALDHIAAGGGLGAPPPIGRVTVDEVRRFELIEATLVASARRTVFDQLVAAGRVPTGAEPPPAVQIESANPMEGDTEAMRAWQTRSLPLIGADAVAAVTGVGTATQNGFGRGHDQAEHDPGR
jgi:hypothetical protein